jgi:hypothetical protein
MGDFVEGSSDYDLLVIVADDLSSNDLAALAAFHDSLVSEFPEAIRLEGDYVPRGDLRPEGTSKPAWFFRRGQLQSAPALMLSADNIANLRYAGVAVVGPPAATVLPDVTPAQVRTAMRAMLEEIADLPDEQTAAHEILDLVRSYRALETGMPTTKTEGLRWGLSILDPSFHPLLRHAEAIRRGAPVPPGERFLRQGVIDLRNAFRDRSRSW